MLINKKNILITGACGFIGSHLVEHLLRKNCNIKAFVMYNPLNLWGWLDALPKEVTHHIEVVMGDIRNYDSVSSAMKGIDIVFHLAALIGIPYSYFSPDAYVQTNVNGTLNILQAARDRNVERLIVTSTSEVYGTAKYIPINEDHPLQGQSPYSASKISADMLADSFYRSFDMPIIIARPFNTYGPRQSARAIIPTIITQILDDRSDKIKVGNLVPIRDLNFVDDVCDGFIKIAENDKTLGRAINICSNQSISMKSLLNLIIDLTKTTKEITCTEDRFRPPKSEVEQLIGDNSTIFKLTGWKPHTSLKEGLLKTIAWFQTGNHLSHYKSYIYNK